MLRTAIAATKSILFTYVVNFLRYASFVRKGEGNEWVDKLSSNGSQGQQSELIWEPRS